MFIDTSRKIEILATGTYLPDRRIKSDDIFSDIKTELKYGIPENWMSQEMGIEERRAAPTGTLPSSLAIEAGERALANIDGINIDDIDLVIFCGIERDRPEPATAHTVQNALGLKARKVFDVANACYGFVDGLETAAAYLASGLCKYALVVTGEVSYKISRDISSQLKKGVTVSRAKEIIGALSVGDAGGAVILGNSTNGTSGFNFFNSSCDSRHVNQCYYTERSDGHIDGQMLMGRIVAHGLKMHRNLWADTVKKTGVKNVDWLLSHQTGRRNFEALSKMGGIGQHRMTKTFDKLGNITTATFPVNFDLLVNDSAKRGDVVGGWFAGSGLTVGQFGYTI